MNSVFPNIKFAVEREEDFPNGRLPTLDCELWVEESLSGNFIRYSFFEKAMKNPFCIMQSSAMSSKSKIQILSQEMIRRLQTKHFSCPILYMIMKLVKYLYFQF